MDDKAFNILAARITETAERNFAPRFFDFYDEAVQKRLEPLLERSGEPYLFWGGTADAARKMLCIYPEYCNAADLEWPMAAFRFQADFPLDHRNVLGEMMAQGITRECLGDINVVNGEVQVIFVSRMQPFFERHLSKFKGRSVQITWHDARHIKNYPLQFKEMSFVAASDRVDGIIGKIWGFSRQNALVYIHQKRLRVNDREVLKNDYHLCLGDVIALRGKGKAIIAEIEETRTKKGNLRFVVKKYI